MDKEDWVVWLQAKFKEAKIRPEVTVIDVVIDEMAAIREKLDGLQREILQLEQANPKEGVCSRCLKPCGVSDG
jgi:hypothetical protein